MKNPSNRAASAPNPAPESNRSAQCFAKRPLSELEKEAYPYIEADDQRLTFNTQPSQAFSATGAQQRRPRGRRLQNTSTIARISDCDSRLLDQLLVIRDHTGSGVAARHLTTTPVSNGPSAVGLRDVSPFAFDRSEPSDGDQCVILDYALRGARLVCRRLQHTSAQS